ncbi:hypothetical protein [Luethyella okanaganae]|uniref:FHA domain-containing protein n=1 Tax=Luethyella okanaganae TaxID=69372 RepID=A0ABW1VGX1_9MICO
MNCQICAAELPDGAMFCGECGSSTTATPLSRKRPDPRPSDTTIIQPLTPRIPPSVVSVSIVTSLHPGALPDADRPTEPEVESGVAPELDGDAVLAERPGPTVGSAIGSSVGGREAEVGTDRVLPGVEPLAPQRATAAQSAFPPADPPERGAAVASESPEPSRVGASGSHPVGSGSVGSGSVGSGSVGSGPVGSGPVGSGPVGSDHAGPVSNVPEPVTPAAVASEPVIASGPIGPAGFASTDDHAGPVAPVDATGVPPAVSPREAVPFALQFSTGESVIVLGTGLVGRRPLPQPGEHFDHLIQINDIGMSVSKSHLEFGQHDGELWVSDRFSGNGTVIRRPDDVAVRCEPGRRYLVPRGSRVELADQFFVVN